MRPNRSCQRSSRLAALVASVMLAISVAACGQADPAPVATGTPIPRQGSHSGATQSGDNIATRGPEASPTPEPFGVSSLSDPSVNYYVQGLPEDLDTDQQAAVQSFVDYDLAAWRTLLLMDGKLSRVQSTATGEEISGFMEVYHELQGQGRHRSGRVDITVIDAQVDPGATATVEVCADLTKVDTVLNDTGTKITNRGLAQVFHMVYTLSDVSGRWLVQSSEVKSLNDC